MSKPVQMLPQPTAGLDRWRSEKGVLCCPDCGKLIPLVGKREVIRHPVAERLRERSYAITGWWTLFLFVAGVITGLATGGFLGGRAGGWAMFFLPALPGFLIYFFVRCFPRYRVTKCPFCKFVDLQKIGW